MDEIKTIVINYFDLLFKRGIILVVLSAFFLFETFTTEFYDTPKFIVLLLVTGALLVLSTAKFTISNKVVLIRTPLDIPLLLLLAVAIASTFLSPSPYISLLGNQLKIHGSLVSLVVYILFYFVLVNNLKNAKDIKGILYTSLVGAQILATLSLLAYAGIKLLPSQLAQNLNFTPTGSPFSTTAVLAILLPFTVMQILNNKNPTLKIINAVFLLLMGLTITLTGVWATWIAALLGLGLTLAVSNLNGLRNLNQLKPITLVCLSVPLVIIALVTALSFIPPIGGAKNPIYTQAQNFPREIQLPFITSWKISISAFRDFPIWGTGPSTYLANFTNYKPIEFNQSKSWDLRFDSSFNEYLQTLATLGGVGLIALLSLTALFVSSAYKTLLYHYKATTNDQQNSLKTAFAVAGLSFFTIIALHPSSLIVWIIGILVVASFMALNFSENLDEGFNRPTNDFKAILLKITNFSTVSSKETIKVDALPAVLLSISIILVVITLFFGGKFVLADYQHKQGLDAFAKNQGSPAYNALIAAEKLNPYNDVYRVSLAKISFALANALASAKGPTESSPAGSLTEQDKQEINNLLQQSVNEAKTAVTLNPKSVINLEILATLYRQISGVAQNALLLALDSYGRAILQDPLNPILRIDVGGVYYAVKNYDMAIRFFTDAINLKPDLPAAYYNLSVALRDKGDLNGAQTAAEKTLTLLDQNSTDYKTANDYLADLKNRIASGSAQESQIQAPAAEENEALQKKQLPKVVNLPKPEKIATPEAVKRARPTPSPIASPSVTPSPSPTSTP